jgi:hypothetical protein
MENSTQINGTQTKKKNFKERQVRWLVAMTT